jgi:hypothetical protein
VASLPPSAATPQEARIGQRVMDHHYQAAAAASIAGGWSEGLERPIVPRASGMAATPGT